MSMCVRASFREIDLLSHDIYGARCLSFNIERTLSSAPGSLPSSVPLQANKHASPSRAAMTLGAVYMLPGVEHSTSHQRGVLLCKPASKLPISQLIRHTNATAPAMFV